jgi:hypothetical protein
MAAFYIMASVQVYSYGYKRLESTKGQPRAKTY